MATEIVLEDVLSGAVRVRVTDGGAASDRALSAEVLVDISDRPTVRQAIDALAVAEVTDAYCMCHGDFAFEFFDAHNKHVAVVGLHHGTSVRWSGWNGDALLRDGHAPLRWLAGQGCDEPLARQRSHDRQLAQERERLQIAEADWRRAAPVAVQNLLDRVIDESRAGGTFEATKLEVARRLRESIPDDVTRAAALLAWHGSGTGRCSGYPLHEALPELALRDVSISHIVAAVLTHPTDAAIADGAIRHLCGWKTRAHQARDVARIPVELRNHLLEVARRSADTDKRGRAERWLSVRASQTSQGS